ncbi:MAG: hypothetical protein OHK0022_31900 [Roseiflexaceae bacterium]
MLKRCLLLLVALLSLSGATARAADTTPGHRVFLPSVRDPGRLIVYSTFPLTAGNKSQLFIQRIGGLPAVEFKPAVNSTYLSYPSWSPDGKLIAFVALVEGPQEQLYVSKPDGSQPRLLASVGGQIRTPVWSPDSSRIAFSSAITNTALYLVNADASGLRRLTTPAGQDTAPSWSPDGRQIVFDRESNTTFTRSLIVLDVDSGAERRVDTGEGNAGSPAWSPDGSTIAYVRERMTVALIAPDGSGKRDLFTLNRGDDLFGIDQLTWSPDGRHVVGRPLGYKRAWIELVSADSGSAQQRYTYSPPDNPGIVATYSWGP